MRNVSVCLTLVFLLTVAACNSVGAAGVPIPDPASDETILSTKSERVAVFAGGCFWGIEAVFKHVKGVRSATSGYSGGAAATAHYEIVSTGKTGHAESVKIIYDPSQITYGKLLKIFFSVAHNPTELNRQGPDTGTQYRSAIFFSDDKQKEIAKAYIDQIDRLKVFNSPLMTQVVKLDAFYDAEAYHQDYLAHHPNEPYIVYNDIPKVNNLRSQFPNLYVGQ